MARHAICYRTCWVISQPVQNILNLENKNKVKARLNKFIVSQAYCQKYWHGASCLFSLLLGRGLGVVSIIIIFVI